MKLQLIFISVATKLNKNKKRTKQEQIIKLPIKEIQTIAIQIKILGYWLKEGQYIVPYSIDDQMSYLSTFLQFSKVFLKCTNVHF